MHSTFGALKSKTRERSTPSMVRRGGGATLPVRLEGIVAREPGREPEVRGRDRRERRGHAHGARREVRRRLLPGRTKGFLRSVSIKIYLVTKL